MIPMEHIYLCMSRTLHATIGAMLWGFDQSHCLGDIISEGRFLVICNTPDSFPEIFIPRTV